MDLNALIDTEGRLEVKLKGIHNDITKKSEMELGIKMENYAKNGDLLTASLSIYRGILNRTVPKAFFRLLRALRKEPLEFMEAWGCFFSLLSQRGYSGNWAGCLSEAALFDENAFSVAAAKGQAGQLPPEVLTAVKRDLDIICRLSQITPEQLLESYCCPGDIAGVSATLPKWRTGSLTPLLRPEMIEDSVRALSEYYEKNGCGMFARYRAFIWRDGTIEPVPYPDPIRLGSLKGYEYQRGLAIDNTVAFLHNLGANNCLLYGDRGTGKSSTVKALLNEYYQDGLRLVEMPKESLGDFPKLVEKIAALPLKFIVFIDDLSFSQQDDTFAALKAVLEGGVASRPENALIYATSNRRHLVRETFSERQGDEVHLGDTIQESLSLADRFGLSIHFATPDKARFLEIVRALALERKLQGDMAEIEAGAERWAMERGGRSPRCAKQYIASLEARLKRGLPIR